jgi:hypothetical protein
MMGRTADIASIAEIGWYDWVINNKEIGDFPDVKLLEFSSKSSPKEKRWIEVSIEARLGEPVKVKELSKTFGIILVAP